MLLLPIKKTKSVMFIYYFSIIIIITSPGGLFCFTRLNIMDRTELGRQPFVYKEFTAMLNGEVYNHKDLEKEFGIVPKGKSDCELIPELFSKVKF